MRRDQPGGAENPKRVVLEIPFGNGSEAPTREIRDPAEGIDQIRLRQRAGDRVDREVPARQIRFDRAPDDLRDIEVSGPGHADYPRRLLREENRRSHAGRRERERQSLRVARNSQVELRHRAVEQKVAKRPANDPDRASEPRRFPHGGSELGSAQDFPQRDAGSSRQRGRWSFFRGGGQDRPILFGETWQKPYNCRDGFPRLSRQSGGGPQDRRPGSAVRSGIGGLGLD